MSKKYPLFLVLMLFAGLAYAANDFFQTLNVGHLNVFQSLNLKGRINLTRYGNLTNTGDIVNTGALTNTGAISNTGTFGNTGAATITGTMSVSGLSTLTGGAAAKSAVSISSNTTTAFVCTDLGAVATLPTSTYKECSRAYLITDHKLYVATETVVATDSWMATH